MKRITHLVFVAALACGAQAALAQQSGEIVEVRTASAESHADTAGVGSTGARHGALSARPEGGIKAYLEEMGFAAVSPFPSRGAELDD